MVFVERTLGERQDKIWVGDLGFASEEIDAPSDDALTAGREAAQGPIPFDMKPDQFQIFSVLRGLAKNAPWKPRIGGRVPHNVHSQTRPLARLEPCDRIAKRALPEGSREMAE